jgi:hypothetical protein
VGGFVVRELWRKYKDEVFLAILILYVLTLGLGVIGEVFDVKWILNLPLFRIQ